MKNKNSEIAVTRLSEKQYDLCTVLQSCLVDYKERYGSPNWKSEYQLLETVKKRKYYDKEQGIELTALRRAFYLELHSKYKSRT